MPNPNSNTLLQYTSDQTSVWIQPNGCGTPPVMIGCLGVESISVPRGDITKINCISPFRAGEFVTQASVRTAPDDVEIPIISNVGAQTNWLNKLANSTHCPFPLYIVGRCKGRKNNFGQWEFAIRVSDAQIEGVEFNNLVGRSEINGLEKTYNLKAGAPDCVELYMPVITIHTTDQTESQYAIAFAGDTECGGPCGDPQRDCETGFTIGTTDGVAGALLSNALTDCIGYEVTTGGTSAFANVELNAKAMIISNLTSAPRILVASGNGVDPYDLSISYSDDRGATWTETIFAAAANQYTDQNGFIQRNDGSIWCVTSISNIYVSFDNGATWETREDGTLMTNDQLTSIFFYDDIHGLAAGELGKILVTEDGGEAWYLIDSIPNDLGQNSPTTDKINTIGYTGGAWYIGTSAGKLYRTRDLITWYEVPFSGQLNGTIQQIQFYGCSGVLLFNETSPSLRGKILYSINGYNWDLLTTPPNAGLTAVAMLGDTEFYVTGIAYNSKAVIMKGTAYPFA